MLIKTNNFINGLLNLIYLLAKVSDVNKIKACQPIAKAILYLVISLAGFFFVFYNSLFVKQKKIVGSNFIFSEEDMTGKRLK